MSITSWNFGKLPLSLVDFLSLAVFAPPRYVPWYVMMFIRSGLCRHRGASERVKMSQRILNLASDGRFHLALFCSTCLVERPPRSKHCPICDRQINSPPRIDQSPHSYRRHTKVRVVEGLTDWLTDWLTCSSFLWEQLSCYGDLAEIKGWSWYPLPEGW